MAVSASKRVHVGTVAALSLSIAAISCVCNAQDESWTMWGGNLNNTRSAVASTLLSRTSVGNLTVAWEVSVSGGVSASPLVFGGFTIFPTWAGQVYSLNSSSGAVLWQSTVDDYINNPLCEPPAEYNFTFSGSISRTTPPLAGPDVIFIGTQYVVAAELLAGLPYVVGKVSASACPLPSGCRACAAQMYTP